MIGTPRKPGTPTLKPSTSLGGRTSPGKTAAPAKPAAKSTAATAQPRKTASGVVNRAASAAKSAAIYGSRGSASTTVVKPAAGPKKTTGSSFGNVKAGASSTAAPAARKSVFGNVVGGAVSTAATAPRALPSTYTVLRGDNLSKIAKRLYGKASAWRKLFEANRDQIENPDLIHPGQVLKVPEL